MTLEPIYVKKEGAYLYFFKKNCGKCVRYNLIQKCIERQKGGWERVHHQYTFFLNYKVDDLVIEESDIKFKRLIGLAKSSDPSHKSVSTFLTDLSNVMHLESYITEGVNFEFEVKKNWDGRSYSVRMPKKELNVFDKNVIKFFKQNSIVVTEELEQYYVHRKEAKNVILDCSRANNVRQEQWPSIMHQLTQTDFIILTTEYRCDMSSLIGYIWGYIEPFEGIEAREAIRLLRDYFHMSKIIGREVKKYPKYLHSVHDIINANYRAYRTTYDEIRFAKNMREELEHEGAEYSIVIPKNSKDVIAEGTDLNHCVGSYISRIINGETYIMFLRKTKEKDKSLVTLELRKNVLVQAKGAYNRKLNPDESKYLARYCKEKEIKNDESIQFLIIDEMEMHPGVLER